MLRELDVLGTKTQEVSIVEDPFCAPLMSSDLVLAQAAITKYHRLGLLFLTMLEAGKSNMVPADSVLL